MTSALIIGDVHLSDKAPSSRTNTYTEDILDKLRFCVEKANELDVPIVQAGDMFHVKAPSRNSHRLVQRTHEVLKETKQGVWIVPGNHDLSGDRLDTLSSQPVGALARMLNIHLLMGEDYRLPGIYGIPYLTEFDGGDYLNALIEWLGQTSVGFDGTVKLIVTHAPLFPPGDEPNVYSYIPTQFWTDFWNDEVDPKATYYGHIHDCHGTYEVGDHTFCNQGALSRGSLHESTIARKPAVTLWDGSSFTRIEVPHKQPEEVYLFDEAAVKAIRKASAEDFASALGQVTLDRLTLESVLASLRGEVTDKNVLSVIEQVLEDVQ